MLTAVQVWLKEPPMIKMLRLYINAVGVDIVEWIGGISVNSTERGQSLVDTKRMMVARCKDCLWEETKLRKSGLMLCVRCACNCQEEANDRAVSMMSTPGDGRI